MPDPLEPYRKKRDFRRTPEPEPRASSDRDVRPVFVVHRHDARRLHYDLRLEMEGVLRSWAVPKGFSYDPREKRLAVRTEDHPLEYEHFDGVIPRGEYGAGSMTIWDRGVYEVVKAESGPAAVEAGELKVILRGRRLRGEWHLVKTNQGPKNWLLFKSKDRYSGPARDSVTGVNLEHVEPSPFPTRPRRMKPGAEREPFSDPAWLFEASLDGKRVLAEKRGDSVRLRGLTVRLPAIEDGLSKMRCEAALIEGVLCVTDGAERPSRALLDEQLAARDPAGIVFYAFDLLHYEEFDLRPLPLVDRKRALRAILTPHESLLFVDHVPGNGEELAAAIAAAGLPEMIAKRAAGPYVAGASEDWLRVPVATSSSASVSEGLSRSRGKSRRSRVRFTNLEKVYWPGEGFTKGDLITWYETVADTLLPYLEDRPVHMNRFPDGIEGESFYQRKAKDGMPDWIETEWIDSDSAGEPLEYMICNDRDTLLYLANLGSIDFHPWLSRRGSLESPDWAILDLDPKDAPFGDVIQIARECGRLLHEIGLRPLLKTSGKTGLHVYVPLIEGYGYEHARMFCEGVARMVCRALPDIATVERAIPNREGKVYVDFGQNRMGQTVVPPYSARPATGATVSCPLHWDELANDLSPKHFTLQTMPQRLADHGDLFRGALEDRQDLMPAIEALGGMLKERR